jgi:hypothetical protein
MRADRFKQLLKNSVYRTIGETATAIGGNGDGDRTLRVLMYHKVNDLPANPLTTPVSIFDEQMDQLRDMGYTVVDLDAVLDHYVDGKPLPERADDRDPSRNRCADSSTGAFGCSGRRGDARPPAGVPRCGQDAPPYASAGA